MVTFFEIILVMLSAKVTLATQVNSLALVNWGR